MSSRPTVPVTVRPLSEYEPWPLDLALLGKLPDEGLLGGVHHRGIKAKDVAEQVSSPEVTVRSPEAQGRLRQLRVFGLVETFPATGGRIWARTKLGHDYWLEHVTRPGDGEDS